MLDYVVFYPETFIGYENETCVILTLSAWGLAYKIIWFTYIKPNIV